jgi:glycosyltransferase involved in cell wall biosynthesis
MRVLIVSDVTGYMPGGVPAETAHLVRGLAARGHTVALAGDVLPCGADAALHLPLSLPTGAALSGEVRRALEAAQPDVVHVMAMSSRSIARIVPVLDGVPWLMTAHSLPPHERKLPRFHANERLHYGARWLRFLPHAAAWKWLLHRHVVPQVVVHSEAMRRVVLGYGQRPAQLALIPLGSEVMPPRAPLETPPAGPAPRILTIAGLAHTKGQHNAIAAVATLRGTFPRLTYRIVGEARDASYEQYLRMLIDRNGLADCVRITANLPHDEKKRALREADLYLQPSHEEGFCLAYIEAARVVPRLVGADTGAIRAIGAGDAGARTVRVRAPRELADAMLELLAATLPADLMARRGRRLAAHFSWMQYLDAHEALYRRVAGIDDRRVVDSPAVHSAPARQTFGWVR